MPNLFERLAERVAKWRADSYASEDYPAIAEILEWAGETEEGELRFLRRPQVRALAAPKGKTTVAVKITDMLGEEVLVTRDV